MTVTFHVGTVPDGRRLYSTSGEMPVDGTAVWVEESEEKTTVAALDDLDTVWKVEPEPLSDNH